MRGKSFAQSKRPIGQRKYLAHLKVLAAHDDGHVYQDGKLLPLITEECLRKSGALVKQNVGPGKAHGMISRFMDNGAVTIPRLHADIHAGIYRPDKVYVCEFSDRFRMPSREPKTRLVGFLTARDKVIQKAVADILSAIYDKSFQNTVFGYRPNRGVEQARKNLEVMLWPKRAKALLKIDIMRFFDNIPKEDLLKVLSLRIGDQSILNLIRMWLYAESVQPAGTEINDTKGITQGSGLAPVLSNIYMDHFYDTWVSEQLPDGVLSVMRYADDIVVACEARDSAEKAKQLIAERLKQIGLSISIRKTKIVSLEGLERRPVLINFLGESFVFSERQKHEYFRNTKNTKKVRRHVSRSTALKFMRKLKFFLTEKTGALSMETISSRQKIMETVDQFIRKIEAFTRYCRDSTIGRRRASSVVIWAICESEKMGLLDALSQIEAGKFEATYNLPPEIRDLFE